MNTYLQVIHPVRVFIALLRAAFDPEGAFIFGEGAESMTMDLYNSSRPMAAFRLRSHGRRVEYCNNCSSARHSMSIPILLSVVGHVNAMNVIALGSDR